MSARIAAAAVALALASGCRPASESMARQARYEEYEPSTLFDDGGSARHLPAGVVARVAAHDGHTPRLAELVVDGGLADAPDEALLARGRVRFGIWCSPCHGWTGLGDGAVVQRGYPAPPSFTEQRLRDASDHHLFTVISDGLGKMPPYGPHVPLGDRRAIVAWIRVLQRSQHARVEDAPAEVRERLAREPDVGGEEPR